MNQTINCLLCGNEALLIEEKFPGYQEPDTFTIYDCSHCNTQFSYPRVETTAVYELIYKNADKVKGYDRYYKYKNVVKTKDKPLMYLAESEEAYWVVNQVLKQDIEKKEALKILEVGCGMGYLTFSLKKEGFLITGLDISENAIAEAINFFGPHYVCADVFEFAKNHKEEFDRIIFTQVFEHVEEPIKWIETLIKMLKKGGKVILTTENKSFYPRRTVWQTDLPPVHLWWFSEHSMKYIADKIKTEINFVDFSSYTQGEEKGSIIPVNQLKHRFNKYGEPICDGELLPRNFVLKGMVKNFKMINQLYLAINPYFLKYFRFKKSKNDLRYGEKRGIMGCVIIKK